MHNNAIFLAVSFVVATALLCTLHFCDNGRGDADIKNDEALNLEVGSHLFKLNSGRFCTIVVEKDGSKILLFDDNGNEDGISYQASTSVISFTRVTETEKIMIIDKNGDGLADIKMTYNLEGKFVSKESLPEFQLREESHNQTFPDK